MGEALLRVLFTCVDGTLIEREWEHDEAGAAEAVIRFSEPPDWLTNSTREWPHPQGPIILRGVVRPGRCNEAWEFVHGF